MHMHSRTWEPMAVLVTGSAAVLWVAGIVLFLGVSSRETQHLGLLLVVIAATVTALAVLRSWQLRMHRAFVHGYHAGWHEQCLQDCYDGAGCEVLDFAEVQSRKLARLS